MSTAPASHSPAVAAELALRGTAVLARGLVPDALLLIADGDILWAGRQPTPRSTRRSGP